MQSNFSLPAPIAELVSARNKLRKLYSNSNLKFTIDGNLVGDIGEAIAMKMFSLKLVASNSTGIDALTSNGHSVQIKATGTNRGPAFRMTEVQADYLLFFGFDFENLTGQVLYNGPEKNVISLLPNKWQNQRSIPMSKIISENSKVLPSQRLPYQN